MRSLAIISAVTRWAVAQPDVVALALVGSHARLCARLGSDIDFMVLVLDPALFRSDSIWLGTIQWPDGQRVTSSVDKDYGVAWSRHIELDSGELVELTFAAPEWANTAPLDSGTLQVSMGGLVVLHDPRRLLVNLLESVRNAKTSTVKTQ